MISVVKQIYQTLLNLFIQAYGIFTDLSGMTIIISIQDMLLGHGLVLKYSTVVRP